MIPGTVLYEWEEPDPTVFFRIIAGEFGPILQVKIAHGGWSKPPVGFFENTLLSQICLLADS